MPLIRPTDPYHFGTLTADTFVAPDNAITADSQIRDGADIARSKNVQENLMVFPMRLDQARVWNSGAQLPTAVESNDDLALIMGTLASAEAPTLQTEDKASNGAVQTQKAAWLFDLPLEYQADETVQVRVSAAMAALADVSATVDVEVYEINRQGGVSADLCTTTAQTINSTTWANKDFTVTDTDLARGNQLLVIVSVAIRDNATGSGVQGKIGAVELLCDCRG